MPNVVKFSPVVKKMLDNKCLQCHYISPSLNKCEFPSSLDAIRQLSLKLAQRFSKIRLKC